MTLEQYDAIQTIARALVSSGLCMKVSRHGRIEFIADNNPTEMPEVMETDASVTGNNLQAYIENRKITENKIDENT